ncbi:AI-2E family transporter [Pseudomonas sp. BGr12]|uniref:AI-2E family transporter n=1 Tax=unclassified Pseudomonas TaxID=196821 RepID=UPI00177BB247|nr:MULTISPECIES: AI-2E family transporter [unclassified Pseudomonas]MBD9501142.1 AI-2E family transporter [Pseudomonas sp. PDM17]MBD9579508.1 AI-2E family transporter [Pseudomonas sp. PDM23]MBD9674761.1 AI-2E family transporter [Pseudomonas sp. PDM21]MDL2428551.1 AI-2E family transporter [Pseudomonas sp. BJa5]
MFESKLEYRTFLALLLVVTLAFGWILLPFYGAVFWGTILAIIFAPLQRRLRVKLNGRNNLAALISLAVCFLIVILPVTFIAGALVQEGATVYQRLKSGELNFIAYYQQAVAALPGWAHQLLERFDLADLSSLQEKLSAGAMQASQLVATKAFSIGQNTFEFVISFGIMLYLLFFLLRDGPTLGKRIKQAVPLSGEHKQHLFAKFTTVIRATVKGNIAVAATQGALGGLIFWFLGIQGSLLWGTLMAFLSLLPAIGAGLIWVPVAAYFLLTGAIWQGVVLTLFCVVVIGLVDNILRPILVGKDTKMPDYVVLISTLGGMSLFGLNGFVIGPLIAALFMASWDLFTGREGEAAKPAE